MFYLFRRPQPGEKPRQVGSPQPTLVDAMKQRQKYPDVVLWSPPEKPKYIGSGEDVVLS